MSDRVYKERSSRAPVGSGYSRGALQPVAGKQTLVQQLAQDRDPSSAAGPGTSGSAGAFSFDDVVMRAFGQSASPAGGAPVQRQSTGAPTSAQPTTTSAPANQAPASAQPTTSAPANQAPDATAASSDPPSRHATWDQISGAAEDAKGQQRLDIEWVGALPEHLRDTIDTAFADTTATQQVTQSARPGLAKIDAELNAALKDLTKKTKKRLVDEHKRATDRDVTSDPTFVAERDQLEEERTRRKQEHVKQTRDANDAAVAMKRSDQSVARSGTPTVRRLEGKALARTNFMSWAVDIFGSAETAKSHFRGILAVRGHPNMWLAASARARFEAAQSDFESRHPGYSIVDTSVANDLRGMHQQRWGIGMLGHAIGESFDLKAIDNPNIKIDDIGHNYAYLIGKFGGEQNKRGTGRAKMQIAESAVEKTGKETAAGRNTPEGAALIESVRQQFEEMSATSTRLKSSMTGEMPRLEAARDLYFDQAGLRVELAKAKADLQYADGVAAKRLAGQKLDAEAKKAAVQQIKRELAAAVDHKKEEIARSQAAVKEALTTAFAAWTQSIQRDIDTDQSLLDQNQASRAAMTAEEQALAAIDVGAEDAKARLSQFATDHHLTTLDKMRPPPRDAQVYKAALVRELKLRNARATTSLGGRDADARADMRELQFYQQKLLDPAFVFGHGEKSDDGHWRSKYGVSEVALMQLLEHGTVRDDPMPEPAAGGARQGVYNAAVVTTLAKFGFAPGAAYGDTMHFDFVEGFNTQVPGGRSGPNMKRTRYSPEGDLPPPAPAPANTTSRK